MQVILLDKIGKLGTVGDTVNVRPGFGRNYLLPKGKALTATKANLLAFEAKRAELEEAAGEKRAIAERKAAELAELTITIIAKAGDEGKLFGSVGTRDIAEALASEGVEISKSDVKLPDGVLRELGEYKVNIELHNEIIQELTLLIEAE